MRTLSFILILFLAAIVPLTAQTLYTSNLSSGEGRFDRAANATFWVNPAFLIPSIFFSSDATSLMANRKWWRAESRRFPELNNTLIGSQTPDLRENAFAAFIEKSNFLKSDFKPSLLRYDHIFFQRDKQPAGEPDLPN